MNHVKFYRNKEGITQEDFAKICGISRVALSLIENGNDCRVSTALRICTVLNRPFAEVFPSAGLVKDKESSV